MGKARVAHVVGFDDAPFEPAHRGNVLVIGTVYAGTRLEGVVSCQVRRDGANATRALAQCVRNSRFYPQLHAVLLQGIALAGFNVVDIELLRRQLRRPVLVVIRRRPDLRRIERALLAHVPGGAHKWRLILKAGPVERIGGLYVQRAGLTGEQAEELLRNLSCNGKLPEPLRAAHLIAGALTRGQSSGRA